MPFNGSGVFNRIMNWVNDAANSIPITASRTDTDTNDIASGLTNCVTRDGQSPPTANLPMGGFRFTNAGNAVLGNEFITMGQVSTTYLPLAGGTMTGKIALKGTTGVIGQAATAQGQLSVVGSAGANAAFLEFNRTGVFASYIGLDTDNQWKVGGWSAGAVSFRIVHEGLSTVGLNALTLQTLFVGATTVLTGMATVHNTVAVDGAAGGFQFAERTNINSTAQWYATGGSARLFGSAFAGDMITVNLSNSNTTVTGTWTGPNFIGTSDERLKENIEDAVPRSDLADLLRFVSYIRKSSGRHELGLIAQDLKKVAPEFVYEGDDGILGIDKASLAIEVSLGLAIRIRSLESR